MTSSSEAASTSATALRWMISHCPLHLNVLYSKWDFATLEFQKPYEGHPVPKIIQTLAFCCAGCLSIIIAHDNLRSGPIQSSLTCVCISILSPCIIRWHLLADCVVAGNKPIATLARAPSSIPKKIGIHVSWSMGKERCVAGTKPWGPGGVAVAIHAGHKVACQH